MLQLILWLNATLSDIQGDAIGVILYGLVVVVRLWREGGVEVGWGKSFEGSGSSAKRRSGGYSLD